MSDRPIENISCSAVNVKESFPNADVKYRFLIELVIVTDSWEMRAPTAQGHVPLRYTEEGQRVRVIIGGDDKLRFSDEEEVNPILQASCVSQAILENLQIGRTWIVHCEGVPRYLLNLCAGLNEDTRELQTHSCPWDQVLAVARQQLETIKKDLIENYSDPDLYRKQEQSLPGGSHVLEDYQQQLQFLDRGGRRRLEAAKNTVERPDF